MNRLIKTALTMAIAASGVTHESEAATSPESLAARAVQLLSRGDARSVASMMHYPPKYTAAERKADVSSTGDGLTFIAGEFGAASAVKALTGPWAFYEVGGTGGDVRYL